MNKLLISLSSTSLRLITALALIMYLSNTNSIDIFAIYSIGSLLGLFVSLFIDSGINNEILGNINKKTHTELKEYIDEFLFVRTYVGLISTIIVLSISLFIYTGFDLAVFMVAYLSTIMMFINESGLVLLKSQSKFKLEVYLVLFQMLCFIIMGCVGLILKCEWFVVFLILIPRVIIFYFLFFRLFECKFDFISILSFPKGRVVLYYSKLKYYSIDSILSNVNLQLDNLILPLVAGSSAFALNQPLNKLYQSVIGLSSAIASYVIPKASKKSNAKEISKFIFSHFSTFGLFVSCAFLMFASFVIDSFYPADYHSNAYAITLYSFLIFIRYIAASLGAQLMLLSFQSFRAKVNLVLTLLFSLICLLYSEDLFDVLHMIILSQLLLSTVYLYKLRLVNVTE